MKNGKLERGKAIVIASGSSLFKTSVLDVIARENNPDLAILVTDRSLLDVLKKGITPDKFPLFYSSIQENLISPGSEYDHLPHMFCHEEIYPYTKQITLFCSQLLTDDRKKLLNDMGFQIRHFNRISKGPGPGPIIRSSGNNGMTLIEIARHVLKIKDVGFIGLDLDYSTSWSSYENSEKHEVENMLKLSLNQVTEDFIHFNHPIFSLSSLGNFHGKGISEKTVYEFLGPGSLH